MSTVWDPAWAAGTPPLPDQEVWLQEHGLQEDEIEVGHELTAPSEEAPAAAAEAGAGALWVAGAERVENPRSRGGSYVGGPWRFVFHTIEAEPSADRFRRMAARHRSPPHLWAMPSADLLLQTVPLDRSAYALARPGATHTNRRQAVQVEVWGHAKNMAALPSDVLDWLADRVLAPVARLVPIDLTNVRPAGTSRCYGAGSPCRMSAQQWLQFDGVCGHKDVPDNAHWDPGGLDMAAVAARARDRLAGTRQEGRGGDDEALRTVFSWPREPAEWSGPVARPAGGRLDEAGEAEPAGPLDEEQLDEDEQWESDDEGHSVGEEEWEHVDEVADRDDEIHVSAWPEPRPSQEGDAGGGAADGEGGVAVLAELLAAETGAAPGPVARLSGLAALFVGAALRRGSSGAAVAALQRVLTDLGHPLAADGAFGPRTEQAVRAFQAGAGLAADGVVGPRTKAALAAALGRGPTPPGPAPAAPEVRTIPVPVPRPCVQVPVLTEPDRGCLARDPSSFAGVVAIRAFAEQLAACTADRNRQRAGNQPPTRRALQLADVAVLERDFADTVRAGQGRMGNRCRFNDLARGWMFGRREEVDFHTLGTGGRAWDIASFLPAPGQDRLEPMEMEPARNAPVQPLLNRLLRELRGRHRIPRASNYSRTHGGGKFSGRGFSVDLYIEGGQDERGFYHRDRAVAMLLALDAAASTVGAVWRVLYNDYAVAAAVNRHTGLKQVVFIGQTRPGGTNLNWHGPLILHFHLDIAPARS